MVVMTMMMTQVSNDNDIAVVVRGDELRREAVVEARLAQLSSSVLLSATDKICASLSVHSQYTVHSSLQQSLKALRRRSHRLIVVILLLLKVDCRSAAPVACVILVI